MKTRLREFCRTCPDLVDLHPYDHIPYDPRDKINGTYMLNWWDDVPAHLLYNDDLFNDIEL